MRNSQALSFMRSCLNEDASGNTPNALAKRSLVHSQTYRLPQSADNDRLIGFKTMYRLWRQPVLPDAQWKSESGDELVITGRVESVQSRRDYVYSIGLKPRIIIAKDNLACNWRTIRSGALLALFSFGLLNAFRCFLLKQSRVQYALLLQEAVEAQLIINLIQNEGIVAVHDFAQFEIDSNYLYQLIKKVFPHVKVSKYPSPGPLTLHNSILLSDELCYNTPYHLDELENLPDVVVKDKNHVPTEGYLNYASTYANQVSKPTITLGYYSHGGWVRQLQGDSDDGVGIPAREEELLSELSILLEKNNHWSLKIYSHPNERVSTNLQTQEDYYKQFFKSFERVEITRSLNEQSTLLFNEVELGIGVYSTILFERLYCGFKTLIVAPVEWFPVKNSSLNEVSTLDISKVESMIENLLIVPTDEFIDRIGWTENNLANDLERFKPQFKNE